MSQKAAAVHKYQLSVLHLGYIELDHLYNPIYVSSYCNFSDNLETT